MHHPSSTETPTEAFMGEVGRTAGEAGIGLLKSPLDLIKNTLGMVRHPIDTIENTANAVAHPVDTFNALGDNPREAGSLLGQMLIAPKVPGMMKTAALEGPGVVGRTMGTVGRGLEAGGSAVLDAKGPLGMTAAGTAAFGHPGYAALEFGVPFAAKYGGRGIQRLGASLEGLKLASAPEVPVPLDTNLSGMMLSPEAMARNIDATNMRDVEGFSHTQAGKLAGIPGAGEAVVSDVPMGQYSITDEMVNGAMGKAKPKAWNPDPSELEFTTDAEWPTMKGLREAATKPTKAVTPKAPASIDPMKAAQDDAVRRYLASQPNSSLSRLSR
jgi:hypothetical protein